MPWDEIRKRIGRGEDDETEFKEWRAFPKKVAEAACALANSDGGLIILGIADSGEILGVDEDPESVQERLTSFLHSALNAPLRAALGHHQEGSAWIHWIEVRRYRGPEPLRSRGRVFIRRGRASVEPSPAELQSLFNSFGFILTEEQDIPESRPEDVDERIFRSFLKRQGVELEDEPQPDLLKDLRNRGIVTRDGDEDRLTLYGLMCFGRSPQSYRLTRSAWIEMVAYAGSDRADDVILRGEAAGRIDEQVERALGWSRALGSRETYEDPLYRTDHPLIPEKALREGLVNAVVHRDYAILGSKILLEVFSDRVDITSPGELPNHLTVESALGGHPRSRNELMAHYMLVRRMMEMRGRGLPIVRREMRAFNKTEPELINDVDGRFVRLRLRR